jgi:hypothetical protein
MICTLFQKSFVKFQSIAFFFRRAVDTVNGFCIFATVDRDVLFDYVLIS